MYEIIKSFVDLTDGGYRYNLGDTYPRDGVNPSQRRIKELLSNNNKQGVPLIKSVPSFIASETGQEISISDDGKDSDLESPETEKESQASKPRGRRGKTKK